MGSTRVHQEYSIHVGSDAIYVEGKWGASSLRCYLVLFEKFEDISIENPQKLNSYVGA